MFEFELNVLFCTKKSDSSFFTNVHHLKSLAKWTFASSPCKKFLERNVDDGSSVVDLLSSADVSSAETTGWSPARWAVGSGANSWAGFDVVALQVAWACGGVGWSVVALLVGVEDSITTSGFGAAGSAFVSKVGIVIARVTFLTSLDDAISTNWGGSGGPRNLSSVQRLRFTGVSSRTKGGLETGELAWGQGSRVGQNVPGDLLGARGSGERTRVSGNGRGSTEENVGPGDLPVDGSGAASARVLDASG